MNPHNEPIDVFSKTVSHEKQLEHIDAREIVAKGILAIIFSLLSMILGLIFVKQCFDLVRGAEKDIANNPGKYLDTSIQKIKTGKLLGYIGLGIFLVEVILLIGFMSVA